MNTTIETKVIAATAGGGIGAAVGQFLLWGMGVVFWGASANADKSTEALAAVPAPVSILLVTIVAAVGALAAGFWAPHTSRTVLPAPTAEVPVVPAIL